MNTYDTFDHLFRSIDDSNFHYLGVVLIIFILLGIIFRLVRIDIISWYKGLFNSIIQTENAKYNKEIIQTQIVNFLLAILFILNFSVLIGVYTSKYSSFISISSSYMQMFFIIGGCSIFYAYNLFVFYFVGKLFLNKEQVKNHHHFMGSIFYLAGILLSFPAILALLVPDEMNHVILISTAIILVLTVFFIIIHLSNNFSVKPISIFYMILYLCIFEIVPLYWSCYLVKDHL